jgi:hypothetical protein
LELAEACGAPSDYLKIISLNKAGAYRLIVGYEQEDVGRACLGFGAWSNGRPPAIRWTWPTPTGRCAK